MFPIVVFVGICVSTYAQAPEATYSYVDEKNNKVVWAGWLSTQGEYSLTLTVNDKLLATGSFFQKDISGGKVTATINGTKRTVALVELALSARGVSSADDPVSAVASFHPYRPFPLPQLVVKADASQAAAPTSTAATNSAVSCVGGYTAVGEVIGGLVGGIVAPGAGIAVGGIMGGGAGMAIGLRMCLHNLR